MGPHTPDPLPPASPSDPVWCCVCRQVPFARILAAHDGGSGDIPELQRRTGFGTGCGTCVPYVRLALATRRARLPILSASQLDAALARISEAANRDEDARPIGSPSSMPERA
ncbi:MAG: (2Fe-2S)-binding protein [Phycisphaerales bacterium]